MNDKQFLITTASWEPRFILGFEQLVKKQPFDSMIMYYLKDYAAVTLENRNAVKDLCSKNKIHINQIGLSNNVEAFKLIYKSISELKVEGENVVVDISTMPREIIWTVFYLLNNHSNNTHYIYHKPTRYSSDWLSRDPGKPRLVYKLSGMAEFGLPTVLVILTGYDVDRVSQLIHFFEPSLTLLGLQEGSQYDNQKYNVEKHLSEFPNRETIKLFSLDAYSSDQGFAKLQSVIKPYSAEANLIMSSLGPKLSAVSLFRLHESNNRIGLAYAPSGEFNLEYSEGYDESVEGIITH